MSETVEFQFEDDVPTRCGECEGNIIVDEQTGEAVCRSCGVVTQLVSRGPEWRAFNWEQFKSRVRTGPPAPFGISSQTGTKISIMDRDAHGVKIKPEMTNQIRRMRRWEARAKLGNAHKRNLALALPRLDKLGSVLHLPRHVIETAANLYQRAMVRGFVRGRSIEEVMAATAYLACRMCDIIRPLEDFASAIQTGKKDISRYYRNLVVFLNIKVPRPGWRSHVSKIVNNTNLPSSMEEEAVKILSEAEKRRITSGKMPASLAAAALYIASRMLGFTYYTQVDLARAAGTTEVTLRNRYKDLLRGLDLRWRARDFG